MVLGGPFVGLWIDMDEPHIYYLTIFFFALYLLMATQDIAVDGWALTMLHPDNVNYASTCNSVGQTLGYFISYVGFLALHDPATCNSYLRSTPSDDGTSHTDELVREYCVYIFFLFYRYKFVAHHKNNMKYHFFH